jgi:hypothetical protein
MFSLTEDDKGKSLSIFYGDGESETVAETHVSFKAIIEKLLSGKAEDEEIRELTRVIETLKRKLTALSERVSVDGETVFFDGDAIDGSIADLIKKMFEDGRALDFKPLVNFLEKAKTNPSLKSVDDLYKWAKNGDLMISPEGDILAYKALLVKDGIPVSVHSGKAFVNGEEVEGHIPNVPGTVISMARSQVTVDEQRTCAYGLHAGTHAYATEFASWQRGQETTLVLVQINPRDVVSVPYDYDNSKMRVSRYTVVSEVDKRLTAGVYIQDPLPEPEDEEPEDEEFETPEEWDEEGYDDEEHEEEFEDEAEDEELDALADQAVSDIRDALGRFKKGAGAIMKRDSKGRFV